MEIQAKVVQVLPMEGGTSRSGNAWSKASVIAETLGQYPKKIKISNMKNADAFSRLAAGTEATFKVEIESREHNGRWYTEVSCWGWDVTQQQSSPAPQQAYAPTDPYAAAGMQTAQQAPQVQSYEGDSLLF